MQILFSPFSLQKHRQEKESLSSAITDLQNRLQQSNAANTDLEQQLQHKGGESGQLQQQLRDTQQQLQDTRQRLQDLQQEYERLKKQFDEYVAGSNETNTTLSQNLEVAQKQLADLRAER